MRRRPPSTVLLLPPSLAGAALLPCVDRRGDPAPLNPQSHTTIRKQGRWSTGAEHRSWKGRGSWCSGRRSRCPLEEKLAATGHELTATTHDLTATGGPRDPLGQVELCSTSKVGLLGRLRGAPGHPFPAKGDPFPGKEALPAGRKEDPGGGVERSGSGTGPFWTDRGGAWSFGVQDRGLHAALLLRMEGC